MKKTEAVALTGLAITVAFLGFIAVNDDRLAKYIESDPSSKKPFVTKEKQSLLIKATLAKVAITGAVLAYMIYDVKKLRTS